MDQRPIRNRFFHDLLDVNDITDFSRWFFYSGMIFGSSDKWWGKKGDRPSPHEGLDIGFYIDNHGNRRPFTPAIRIPVMDNGEVYYISEDDFIDSSIFVRHEYRDSNGWYLYSVYAHCHPHGHIKPGQSIQYGDSVATLGDPAKRNLKIPAHLHVSLMFLSIDYPPDMLKWDVLALSYQARLVDPFGYLDCDYRVEPYTFTS